MNPYEAARERLEQAVAALRAAKKDRAEAEAYLIKAEAEWAGATYDLRQYETTPGIPLPQYRQGTAPCSDLHGDDRTRTPHYHAEYREQVQA